MKVGQLRRKRDEECAEDRWIVMDILRESCKVFHVDSTRRLPSLGRGELVERESACGSLIVRELQSRDVVGTEQ